MRCSTWTREHGVDPIGTAGSYSGYLLVEWPLPWPRDVAEIPELGDLARQARAAGVRLQAVVSESRRGQGSAEFYGWDQGVGGFRGRRADVEGDPARLEAWLDGEEPQGAIDVTDAHVLICAHGRRDRCCGSLGTALESDLDGGSEPRESEPARQSQGASNLGPGVRVSRTSHTGGHRFAPTAVVLPEGTCWGYLDPQGLAGIVARRDPVTEHIHRYRGCAGLSGSRVQALERAVMAELGWSLLDRARGGRESPDGTTRLIVDDGPGRRAWVARVVVRRRLPVPECGSPVSVAQKTEDELEVRELREVDPEPLSEG